MQRNGPQQEYASLNQRVLALVIDLVLAALITVPLLTFFYGSQLFISPYLFEGAASILLIVVILPLTLLIFWKTKGASPGKLILRIRIVSEHDRKPPNITHCFIRLCGYFIAIATLGISIFTLLFNSKHQALHDKLANTLVVKTPLNTRTLPVEKTRPRKIIYYLSLLFSSLLIVWVTALGLINLALIPAGYLPAEKLYTDASTPEYARKVLHKNRILHEDRYILLFHPTGSFFSSNGSILTDDRVITYWTSREGIQIDQTLYTEINRVEMIQSEILFDRSVIVLTTGETSLRVYVSRYNNFDQKFLSVLQTAIQINKNKRRELQQSRMPAK